MGREGFYWAETGSSNACGPVREREVGLMSHPNWASKLGLEFPAFELAVITVPPIV